MLPYWRLSCYYFFYFAFFGAFSPYFTLYLQSISFSAWDIGLVMSQMQLMRLAGPYLWGWLSDRGYRRIVIVRLSGAASLAGFLVFFGLESRNGLLIAMTVLAFFWSAALPLMETLTFDHLHERAAGYSRIRIWGSIGFLAAALGTGALLDLTSPIGVLWVCAAMLIGILAFALAVPEAPMRSHPAATVSIRHILRQARVRALLSACFAMAAAHGAYYVFYSIHLTQLGYDRLQVGALWSLGVVAEILMFMAMPHLTRRYGLRALLLWSYAAAALRFALIGWSGHIFALLFFAQLLHALTFGTYHAATITAINRWFPGNSQARGQALYSSFSFGAGGLLGGLLAGIGWDALGAGWIYTLSALFALAGYGLIFRWVHEDVDLTPVLRIP